MKNSDQIRAKQSDSGLLCWQQLTMLEVCDIDRNNAIQTHVYTLPEVACSRQTLMNSLCKVVEPSSPGVCLSLPHDPDAGVLLSFLPDGGRPLNLAFHSDYINCLLFFFFSL